MSKLFAFGERIDGYEVPVLKEPELRATSRCGNCTTTANKENDIMGGRHFIWPEPMPAEPPAAFTEGMKKS